MKGVERPRGGVPAFLTLLRVLFGSPPGGVFLRGLAGRAGVDRSVSVAYAALALLAGEKGYSCLLARFYSVVLDLSLKACARWLGGRPEDVRRAVADPAVRRGLALVLEGLARYGVTVPQRLPAPFLVVWNFTNACNLRCAHCYQKAGGSFAR